MDSWITEPAEDHKEPGLNSSGLARSPPKIAGNILLILQMLPRRVVAVAMAELFENGGCVQKRTAILRCD